MARRKKTRAEGDREDEQNAREKDVVEVLDKAHQQLRLQVALKNAGVLSLIYGSHGFIVRTQLKTFYPELQ